MATESALTLAKIQHVSYIYDLHSISMNHILDDRALREGGHVFGKFQSYAQIFLFPTSSFIINHILTLLLSLNQIKLNKQKQNKTKQNKENTSHQKVRPTSHSPRRPTRPRQILHSTQASKFPNMAWIGM